MQNQPLAIVQEMFSAFNAGDLERFKRQFQKTRYGLTTVHTEFLKQPSMAGKPPPGLSITFLQPHR